MAVNGHAVYLSTPLDRGHGGKPAAGESHLSGFLESGHTRNSSKAWSKARGGFSVLSLLSADGRELDACRHLRATADGGARVPRSADASRAHTPLSMVWQPRPGLCAPSATRAALIDSSESSPTGLAPPPGALETLSPTGGDQRFGSEGVPRPRLLFPRHRLVVDRLLSLGAVPLQIRKKNQCFSRGDLSFHRSLSQSCQEASGRTSKSHSDSWTYALITKMRFQARCHIGYVKKHYFVFIKSLPRFL